MRETENTQSILRQLVGTLDALLRFRHPAEGDRTTREATIAALLRTEIGRHTELATKTLSIDELIGASTLTMAQISNIQSRSLFYCCDGLITLLIHKRIRRDVIATEEAMLYVQDRLLRDDFRRIRAFQQERGANFVTYIGHVINNLLVDFIRSQSGQEMIASKGHGRAEGEEATLAMVDPAPSSLDVTHEGQLQGVLSEIWSGECAASDGMGTREKLRRSLSLSSKERVFLRAIFQYDLSIGEVRTLPGFEMTTNEAYRFYYQLMDRLRQAFKDADVLEAMREHIADVPPRLQIELMGRLATASVDRIVYFQQQDAGTVECHVHANGVTTSGRIKENFGKLIKRLYAYFSQINPDTAVLNTVLMAKSAEWFGEGRFVVAGVPKTFQIAKRWLQGLRQRFASTSRKLD